MEWESQTYLNLYRIRVVHHFLASIDRFYAAVVITNDKHIFYLAFHSAQQKKHHLKISAFPNNLQSLHKHHFQQLQLYFFLYYFDYDNMLVSVPHL